MKRKFISYALVMLDATLVALVPCLAIMTRFEGAFDDKVFNIIFSHLPESIFFQLLTFHAFGLYRRLWRYAGINELMAVVGAVTAGSAAIALYLFLIGAPVLKSILLLSWFYSIVLIGASRMLIKVMHSFRYNRAAPRVRTLIVGAGDAGAIIAREINQRYYASKELCGFVDDDPYKLGKSLFGAKVLGPTGAISRIVREKRVAEIIIAMPSIKGSVMREIIGRCRQTHVRVKTVPGIYELLDGKVTVQQLRDIQLEDLLRREPVQLDLAGIAGYLTGKRVLVTGAGGSIGSELCRQIAKQVPALLILLGKGENSIYEIQAELSGRYPEMRTKPVIADIRDGGRIEAVFKTARPQVVFHAAAHKHVPLMEQQPEEAVRNNIFGTKTVAEAADRHQAEVFIMVSTDKAVNPTSIMGLTKRVAELVIQSLDRVSATKYAAVRFGNVLGSRGSVVPLFKRQIAAGGPVTVTHPDMKRYFMTIPEAAQLVLQAGALAKGGEVFVLDMGEPVKIVDLACDLIRLSGFTPHKEIPIKFTGVRPGEKLSEELFTAEEGTTATRHAKIFVANMKAADDFDLARQLAGFEGSAAAGDVMQALAALVPAYARPGREVV